MGKNTKHLSFFFTAQYRKGTILGGFESGLHFYNIKSKLLEEFEYKDEELSNSSFYTYTKDHTTTITILQPVQALQKFNTNNQLELLDINHKKDEVV